MGESYVTQGAKLKCSFGDSESVLKVPINHKSFINNKPEGNIMDFKPMFNIYPFGMCSSLANPTVSAATAANKGVLKKMPCIPAIVTQWMNGKTDTLIEEFPALLTSSTQHCMWCGTISIIESGQ